MKYFKFDFYIVVINTFSILMSLAISVVLPYPILLSIFIGILPQGIILEPAFNKFGSSRIPVGKIAPVTHLNPLYF